MLEVIRPDWPAPKGVAAMVTTRHGGYSRTPWHSFNLADHVGDDATAVRTNRELLCHELPSSPFWLQQVHGVACIEAMPGAQPVIADASFTRQRGRVCAVLTADCLPVFLCDHQATVVAVAHAGWRGLAAGVIESTVRAMAEPAVNIMAWLGPCIGTQAFEVGDDVRDGFVTTDPMAAQAFVANPRGRWLCDLHLLAQLRLNALGVTSISGSRQCTFRNQDDFFSFRRDGVTGRMASCIWLA